MQSIERARVRPTPGWRRRSALQAARSHACRGAREHARHSRGNLTAERNQRNQSVRRERATEWWQFLPRRSALERSVFAKAAPPRCDGDFLSDPAGGYAGLTCFFLDVGDRFGVRLDLLLHAIEFGERLLPIVSDLCALCRVGTRGEVGRQRVDAALQRVRKRLRTVQIASSLRKAIFPIRFGLFGIFGGSFLAVLRLCACGWRRGLRGVGWRRLSGRRRRGCPGISAAEV